LSNPDLGDALIRPHYSRMYQPKAFREEDRTRLHLLIERHSFGTLIVPGASGELEIAHVPVALDRDATGKERLRLHVAMANPIWRAALAAGRVTVIFNGPHAYVSARFYEQPTEQVPTWNYAVVHAQGTPSRLVGEELVRLLDDLVAVHEGDGPEAWRTSLLDRAFLDELLAEIVGLSIEVTELTGKFKLSQNHSLADHARVVDALARRGGPDDLALVALMRDRVTDR
jgi:transcriptional regulator